MVLTLKCKERWLPSNLFSHLNSSLGANPDLVPDPNIYYHPSSNFDWQNYFRRLFFTDEADGTVNKLDKKTGSITTIYDSGICEPEGIAISPTGNDHVTFWIPGGSLTSTCTRAGHLDPCFWSLTIQKVLNFHRFAPKGPWFSLFWL